MKSFKRRVVFLVLLSIATGAVAQAARYPDRITSFQSACAAVVGSLGIAAAVGLGWFVGYVQYQEAKLDALLPGQNGRHVYIEDSACIRQETLRGGNKACVPTATAIGLEWLTRNGLVAVRPEVAVFQPGTYTDPVGATNDLAAIELATQLNKMMRQNLDAGTNYEEFVKGLRAVVGEKFRVESQQLLADTPENLTKVTDALDAAKKDPSSPVLFLLSYQNMATGSQHAVLLTGYEREAVYGMMDRLGFFLVDPSEGYRPGNYSTRIYPLERGGYVLQCFGGEEERYVHVLDVWAVRIR